MNKAFSLFLMVTLILGGSLGGAFAGGVALGKTQGDESSEARGARGRSGEFGENRTQGVGPGAGPGGPRQRGGQSAGPGGGGGQRGDQGAGTGRDGQQRFGQGGSDSRGPRPDGDGRQGFDSWGGPGEGREGGERRGRRGAGGTIESVEGNTLTIATPRGPVMVTTDDETTLRKVVDGSKQDLKQGVQIRVTGSRDEEGTVKATSITLVPEGAQESLGLRRTRQER